MKNENCEVIKTLKYLINKARLTPSLAFLAESRKFPPGSRPGLETLTVVIFPGKVYFVGSITDILNIMATQHHPFAVKGKN